MQAVAVHAAAEPDPTDSNRRAVFFNMMARPNGRRFPSIKTGTSANVKRVHSDEGRFHWRVSGSKRQRIEQ
jgi:hypothetical protein